MKSRTIVMVVVAGAAAVAAIGLWRRSAPFDVTETAGSDPGTVVAREGASASASLGSQSSDAAAAEPRVIDAAWRTPSTPSPRHAEADDIERLIEQFFAEQTGLEIVSLSSIECGATACEIALTGTEVNPRFVNAYEDLYSRLTAARRNEFRILYSSLGTREIAPGAREYVISFEYQPYVDLSTDPLIAARQYAACAAAWRRQTENPTPDDVARQYLEEADRYVALAASVLGEQEAARLAAEIRGGPLIRECRL